MPLDTQPNWPAALASLEAEQCGETRIDLLRQALDRLERVTWHERWGMSAMAYADDAAELLRRAGLHELADEASDSFGVDVPALVEEINREMGR